MIFGQQREEEMILPHAPDLKILARKSVLREPGRQKQPLAGRIARQTRRLDPVQAQIGEAETEQEIQSLAHVALTRMGLADPVSQSPGLRDPAAHVRHADTAEQRGAFALEYEHAVPLIVAPVARISV